MGRLIDADFILNKMRTTDAQPITYSEHYAWDFATALLNVAPTVEAIPKADYEKTLKADMVAMLTELKNELIDVSWNMDMYDSDLDFECCYLNDINEITQQKIEKYKKESENE